MKTEVLIIGGGIPGLTLALRLGTAGLSVTVVDTEKVVPLKDIEATGRTAALMDGSVAILKQAGVWETVTDKAEALKTISLIDDSSGSADPLSVQFHAHEIGLDAFGYNIPNATLRAALVDAIAQVPVITHLAPARLKEYRVEGAHIRARLEDGQEIAASLIVGADGRRSVTRTCAGITVREKDYGQSALTCLVSHSKSHENVSTEIHRPGGPFTSVPMPGQTSSIVWMEKTGDAERYLRLDKPAFEQALQDRSLGRLGKITLITPPECWPIITLRATALTAERCVLAAEAAHVLSPIGAQGLNLSLRDIACLSDVLIDAARLGGDPGAKTVLERYARARRVDIGARVFGVDTLNRIVGNTLTSLRGVRRLGLKTLQNSAFLRDIVMREGLAK